MAQYVPTIAAEEAFSSTDEDEDQMPVFVSPMMSGKKRQAFKTVAGIMCVVGACALALKTAASLAPQQSLRATQPATVRSLLEGPELANLFTDNVMAVAGESMLDSVDRDQVHAAVARKLLNISNSVRMEAPEAHMKLGLIQLSEAQKGQVFGVLRHYSDHRMIKLSHVVAEAVQETAAEKGDEVALKRRLMEKLAPQMEDFTQLSSELFPSRKSKGLALNFDDAPVTDDFKKWHVQMQMQMGSPEVVTNARRLSAEDLASGVITVQAQSMFDELGEMLGDDMPPAPARILQAMAQQQQAQKPSFMSCMMTAMSSMNPMAACSCVFSNMKTVMAMMSKMMGGMMR